MLSEEVSILVASLEHPMTSGIQELRELIIGLNPEITEDIKWNGPNFKHKGKDRITLRTSSPKLIQIILHLGAKTVQMPTVPFVEKTQTFMELKGNDRVILTFKSALEIQQNKDAILQLLIDWLGKSENY